jgi:hypothetical protein
VIFTVFLLIPQFDPYQSYFLLPFHSGFIIFISYLFILTFIYFYLYFIPLFWLPYFILNVYVCVTNSLFHTVLLRSPFPPLTLQLCLSSCQFSPLQLIQLGSALSNVFLYLTQPFWIVGSNIIWNVGQYLPDYTVIHPRRQSSSNFKLSCLLLKNLDNYNKCYTVFSIMQFIVETSLHHIQNVSEVIHHHPQHINAVSSL